MAQETDEPGVKWETFSLRLASMKILPNASYRLTQMLPNSGNCLILVLPRSREEFHRHRQQLSDVNGNTRTISSILGIYKIRWQNDQGLPRWEVLLPISLSEGDDNPVMNPEFFGGLLTRHLLARPQPILPDKSERERVLKQLLSLSHSELASRCTATQHPNDVVLLAAADLVASGQS